MDNNKKISDSQLEKILTKFRNDIIFFVNECIIIPYNKDTGSNYFITKQQKEGLIKICDLVHQKRRGEAQDILGVSIMSGKGTGKDALTAWVIIWFMYCFPFPKIPCVSVSADQLDKVLWAEISKWYNHSSVKEFFVLQTDKFFRKDVKDTVRGKEWFAFKKAANPKSSPDEQVETLAGQHADYLLEVADECSGMLDPVFDVLEKNMTGYCNLMLLIFNPMRSKGYAIDTQYKLKHRWISLRWNAEESEIVNQNNVKRIEEDFGGKGSNVYRMNVLGLPPIFDEETLFNWDWVLDATERYLEIPPDTSLIYGIDCGAGGDQSIIASRRGNRILPFKRHSTPDSTELVNWIGGHIDAEQPDVARVDTVGIGWAVEGSLRDKKGSIIESADSRRSADNPEMFANKRAEMYWNLREMFEKGQIEIPNDPQLLQQMAATKYEINKRGQIQIIDKKVIKKEIGYSPNELDALAILYYYPDNFISKKTNWTNMVILNRRGTWMRG